MFCSGRKEKATSHPTNETSQNSPSPIAPEPTSNKLPPTGRFDLSSRRIGKKRAARLSNTDYPPGIPCRRHETLDFVPVILIEESAQQNSSTVKHSKDRP